MDITMCSGNGCPIKERCQRFTCTPSEYRQWYFVNPPYEDGKCIFYWGDAHENLMKELEEIVKEQNKSDK